MRPPARGTVRHRSLPQVTVGHTVAVRKSHVVGQYDRLLTIKWPVIAECDGVDWGEHIWNTYGRIIVDCALEAMRTNGEVDCPLAVRR